MTSPDRPLSCRPAKGDEPRKRAERLVAVCGAGYSALYRIQQVVGTRSILRQWAGIGVLRCGTSGTSHRPAGFDTRHGRSGGDF
eukprot:6184553-Pleurochrysis_carterae.AAC.2